MKSKLGLLICTLFLFFTSVVNANFLNLERKTFYEKNLSEHKNENFFFANFENSASFSNYAERDISTIVVSKRKPGDLFYVGVFSVLFILLLKNIILALYLKSKSYLFFLGCLTSWLFVSFCLGNYPLLWSKIGLPLATISATIFYIFFMRDLLELEEDDPDLNKISHSILIFLGIFFLLSPVFNNSMVSSFFCMGSIILFMAPILRRRKIQKTLKIVVCSQIIFAIGLVLFQFFGEQSLLIGGIVHFLILGLVPLNKIKINQEEELKAEQRLSNLLEDVRAGLERSIDKRTREVKDLLDNMNSAVFAIGKDYKILNPVSKYSEKIFKKKIVGKSVSEILYYNIKKGTKEYSDMVTVFSIVFGEGDLQFSALSDNLPKKVQLPIDEHGKNITLKLTYAPVLDEEELVYKVLCIAEDVTGSEEYYLESSDSYLNLKFLKEISENENKEALAKKLEYFVEEAFKILENFVSPLSDTYDAPYFEGELMNFMKNMQVEASDLKILIPICKERVWEIIALDDRTVKVDHQIEATNIICDVLDNLLKYVGSAGLFFKINVQLHDTLLDSVIEKIKDLETQYKNLFEYVFLVRKIDGITDEKIKKVVQLAKLYPDFERSIDLIHQRSRLIFFLLKGLGEDDLAQSYNKLATLVKLMPERSRLDDSIIKNNLILPFKIVLENTKDIERYLLEKFEKNKTYDERNYLDLLVKIFKRFVQESENGPDLKLPVLPPIEPFVLDFLKDSIDGFSSKTLSTRSNANVKELISNLEVYIEKIFKDALKENNLTSIGRDNKQFLKFLERYLSVVPENKKAS